MKLKRIGESSDFMSECGMFQICASNDSERGYLPMKRREEEWPVIFTSLTDDYVSFEEAKGILNKINKGK